MTVKTKPKIGAIAPWYGGNRMNAEKVGELLDGCSWVGIPFAGGMAEIAFIRARTILANDLHCGVISLAECLGSSDVDQNAMETVLRSRIFHPETLRSAQAVLAAERRSGPLDKYYRAIAFFVVAWMTRSGAAGTDIEARGKLALRWEAGGGDSVKRFHSAIDSLPFWAKEFRRCQFSTLECFDFLAKCKDRDGHGIYCDPPFPGPGDKYKHKFTEEDHRELAEVLAGYQTTRIVCRFNDHPLIRDLYPADRWRWIEVGGRTQANKAAPEVLIVNDGGGDAR